MVHTLFPTDQDPGIVGGAELSTRDLVQGLSDIYGHEVVVVRGLAPGSTYRKDSLGKVDVHCLPIARPYWLHDGRDRNAAAKFLWHFIDDLGAAPSGFEDLLRSIQPDVLIMANVVGIGWRVSKIAKNMGVEVIQSLHDYYYLCPRMTLYNNGNICVKQCASCVLLTHSRRSSPKYMDKIVAVSDFSRLRHISSGFRTKDLAYTLTVHNGLPEAAEVLPKKAHDRTIKFGFLGRISPEKGLDLLARSVPKDAELLIGGRVSPSDAERIGALSPGRVTFSGFVNASQFLSEIDVLVVPSLWHEPFGRVSIEAQRAGVPVVVANTGGLPETVLDGVSGWIFDTNEPQDLANILSDIVKRRYDLEKFSISGIENARRFSHMARISAINNLIAEA